MSRLRLAHSVGTLEVAYVEAQQVLDELEIIHIEVLPSHRRQGLAQALLQDLLNTHKPKQVFLEVRETNAAAIALYKKLGFTQIGLRRAYYSSPVEDAITMARTT